MGFPLFLFFINLVGDKDGYVSFLYVGTALFIAYVIANIGAIVYREMPIRKIVTDAVFLYTLSFFAIVAAGSVRYPYNLISMAIAILIVLAIKERVIEWLDRGSSEEMLG